MRALVSILLLAAGCFPDLGEGRIACGAGGSCPPGYVCRADKRCYSPSFPFNDHSDLGMGDLSSGGSGGGRDIGGPVQDLAGGGDMTLTNGGCGPSVARVCLDSGHSAACTMSGNVWLAVPDRTCPPGSTCSGGYCQPPPATAGVACQRDGDCSANGEVCDEYAPTGMLVGHCTMSFPGAAMGKNNPCTATGYNSKCNTDICVAATGNVVGCLEPCVNSGDCGGKSCLSVTAPATIEGLDATTLKFCQP